MPLIAEHLCAPAAYGACVSVANAACAARARWMGLGMEAIVLALFAAGLLRGITDPSLGYADADRILLDGVFVLDFLRDLPWRDPFAYAVDYYTHFPALSIGYRPPLLPLAEAFFNGLLGVHISSARLAVVTFGLIGMSAWFRWIRWEFGLALAVVASALLATTVFVVQWGWYTMSELPVLSLALLSAYHFARYLDTDVTWRLYVAAFVAVGALYTKQTAVFLLPVFVFWAFERGRVGELIRRPEIWVATACSAVLLVPLAAMTLWLGALNIEQSVDFGARQAGGLLSWANLRAHPANLIEQHVGWPALGMAALGLLYVIWARERRAVRFLLLVLGVYLTFTTLNVTSARYAIAWIPVFCLLAALAIEWRRIHRALGAATCALVACTFGYQAFATATEPLRFASGYEAAADAVMHAYGGRPILVDAYNNGYLIYFLRQRNRARDLYVLRGDKLLSSSAITATKWLEVHARTDDDIKDLIDRAGVRFVVVEERDYTGVPIHSRLRGFLKTDLFSLYQSIPIVSNRSVSTLKDEPPLGNQSILIYEYRNPAPLRDAVPLELPVPLVGTRLNTMLRPKPDAPKSSSPAQ
ncbi:MAG: glycosyltransferase family 39 protein [Gammaproteobacteria bacterium]|nr:glycosyltransferase family 39 protein [Gammaproteobacteria bacterium]